jgi:hypothetical protein
VLRAAAREIINGESVSGAVFIFRHEAPVSSGSNSNGEIVKKTSKKGNFHVKSMSAGTYNVKINKKGYKDKEVTVTVTEGERTVLKVELEKV